MSTSVTITFGTLADGWCQSSAQDFVNELNNIVTAVTGDGKQVKIQFGVFMPGTCIAEADDPTQAFIDALNSVTTGYVMGTDDSVRVTFGYISGFCWTDPQSVVAALQANYTAYVEGT